jgi:hypothetical protein
MGQYRCYFFGIGNKIDEADEIEADSDAEAQIRAETLYRKRSNQVYGFEVWQAARLVHQLRT